MTKQQKLEAQRRWSRDYYYRNQAIVQKKNLQRYHDKKAERAADK